MQYIYNLLVNCGYAFFSNHQEKRKVLDQQIGQFCANESYESSVGGTIK